MKAYSTYRNRFRGYFNLSGVLKLTLLDPNYPQSLAYTLNTLNDLLLFLPYSYLPKRLGEDPRRIMKAFSRLQLVSVSDLLNTDPSKAYIRESLDHLLAEVCDGLSKTSSAIVQSYFTHIDYDQQRPLLNLSHGCLIVYNLRKMIHEIYN